MGFLGWERHLLICQCGLHNLRAGKTCSVCGRLAGLVALLCAGEVALPHSLIGSSYVLFCLQATPPPASRVFILDQITSLISLSPSAVARCPSDIVQTLHRDLQNLAVWPLSASLTSPSRTFILASLHHTLFCLQAFAPRVYSAWSSFLCSVICFSNVKVTITIIEDTSRTHDPNLPVTCEVPEPLNLLCLICKYIINCLTSESLSKLRAAQR